MYSCQSEVLIMNAVVITVVWGRLVFSFRIGSVNAQNGTASSFLHHISLGFANNTTTSQVRVPRGINSRNFNEYLSS